MKSVTCLQHVPFEGAGRFAPLFAVHGYRMTTRLVPRDGLPERCGDALLIMGGPMSVNDDLPWLREEEAFLQAAVEADRPVLGICLGAQLLAHAFGGAVARGPRPEIGMTGIRLTPAAESDPLFHRFPESLRVFQWHGEGIAAPRGATVLAASEDYPVQAFRLRRRAYGLLFHLELDRAGIAALLAGCPDDLAHASVSAAQLTREAEQHDEPLQARAKDVVAALVGAT